MATDTSEWRMVTRPPRALASRGERETTNESIEFDEGQPDLRGAAVLQGTLLSPARWMGPL